MAIFVVAQDILERYDEKTVGSLLTKTSTPVAFADWELDTRFIALLDTAEGEVLSELTKADRYTRDQLIDFDEVPPVSKLTAESEQYLIDIICRVFFYRLWKVKPWGDTHDAYKQELKEDYDETLRELRNGSVILELQSHKDAGLPEAADGTTRVDSTRCRYFRSEVGQGDFWPSKASTHIRDC